MANIASATDRFVFDFDKTVMSGVFNSTILKDFLIPGWMAD